MFRKPGPPGEYYGYVEIDGVTYKIEARAMGKLKEWRMLGTVKRHLKADQQQLFGNAGSKPAVVLAEQRDALGRGTGGLTVPPSAQPDPDFNDPLPEKL